MQPYKRESVVVTERQVKIDESLDRLSWLMDDFIRLPVIGWRVGLDALVGLIPGFGDTATSLVSFYILVSAVRYGVPKVTLLRMGMNLGIDYLVGTLPFVGDLFEVEMLREQFRGSSTLDALESGPLADFGGAVVYLLRRE